MVFVGKMRILAYSGDVLSLKTSSLLTMRASLVHPISITREEFVRRRAHEIYQQHGHEQGHELDHWLKAERELDRLQNGS
jgi:hypothetical protein